MLIILKWILRNRLFLSDNFLLKGVRVIPPLTASPNFLRSAFDLFPPPLLLLWHSSLSLQRLQCCHLQTLTFSVIVMIENACSSFKGSQVDYCCCGSGSDCSARPQMALSLVPMDAPADDGVPCL